ncbi:adhesin [Escherichia coli]|uniref:Adhesin n=1 Tax=Escherichia coli TaxID=562 RepID=A0A2X1NE59_ECOLX|nr:adhesin [Escherichia coli]
MKNGAIKSDSYDAINGSQLYAISDSVAKRLGGGAAVDVDDGTVTAPTYNLKNGSKNNVGLRSLYLMKTPCNGTKPKANTALLMVLVAQLPA